MEWTLRNKKMLKYKKESAKCLFYSSCIYIYIYVCVCVCVGVCVYSNDQYTTQHTVLDSENRYLRKTTAIINMKTLYSALWIWTSIIPTWNLNLDLHWRASYGISLVSIFFTADSLSSLYSAIYRHKCYTGQIYKHITTKWIDKSQYWYWLIVYTAMITVCDHRLLIAGKWCHVCSYYQVIFWLGMLFWSSFGVELYWFGLDSRKRKQTCCGLLTFTVRNLLEFPAKFPINRIMIYWYLGKSQSKLLSPCECW